MREKWFYVVFGFLMGVTATQWHLSEAEGQATVGSNPVVATAFVLVNEAGEVTASLFNDEHGPALQIGTVGQPIVSIGTTPRAASVHVMQTEGREYIQLHVGKESPARAIVNTEMETPPEHGGVFVQSTSALGRIQIGDPNEENFVQIFASDGLGGILQGYWNKERQWRLGTNFRYGGQFQSWKEGDIVASFPSFEMAETTAKHSTWGQIKKEHSER